MGPGISWCSVAASLRQAIISSFSFKLDLIERFFFSFVADLDGSHTYVRA
jgi:hypothetical protein